MFPKALICLLLLAWLPLAPLRAQDADPAALEAEADRAFAPLAAVDSLLDARPDAGPAELARLDANLLLDTAAAPLGAHGLLGMPGTERPYGIPPFFWGLALSVPGVFVVYLLTHERRPTHQAILGAIVGGVLVGMLYFIVLAPAG